MLDRDVDAGTYIAAFKGNACGPGGLARLGRDYVVAAQTTRSALHFWTWHKVPLPAERLPPARLQSHLIWRCPMLCGLSALRMCGWSMGDRQRANRWPASAGSFTKHLKALQLPAGWCGAG